MENCWTSGDFFVWLLICNLFPIFFTLRGNPLVMTQVEDGWDEDEIGKQMQQSNHLPPTDPCVIETKSQRHQQQNTVDNWTYLVEYLIYSVELCDHALKCRSYQVSICLLLHHRRIITSVLHRTLKCFDFRGRSPIYIQYNSFCAKYIFVLSGRLSTSVYCSLFLKNLCVK